MNPKDKLGHLKPSISLVPPSAIIHLAEAFKEGARKYGPYNWRENKVYSLIYLDAILRHTLAVIDGEDFDPESGKHHLAGVLASAALYLDALETGNLLDNRPKPGNAGKMIREIAIKNKSNQNTEQDLQEGVIKEILSWKINDSDCLTLEENNQRLSNPNDTYGKGYNKLRNS